jgi:hypothetical protein
VGRVGDWVADWVGPVGGGGSGRVGPGRGMGSRQGGVGWRAGSGVGGDRWIIVPVNVSLEYLCSLPQGELRCEHKKWLEIAEKKKGGLVN